MCLVDTRTGVASGDAPLSMVDSDLGFFFFFFLTCSGKVDITEAIHSSRSSSAVNINKLKRRFHFLLLLPEIYHHVFEIS